MTTLHDGCSTRRDLSGRALRHYWSRFCRARTYAERSRISVQICRLLSRADGEQIARNESLLVTMYNMVPTRWQLSRAIGDAINLLASQREQQYLLGMDG